MNFLEKDLEQILYESPEMLLSERGLYLPGRRFRQVRIGRYGVCDLLYVSRSRANGGKLNFCVVELKKNNIDNDAIIQLIRYIHGIRRYLRRIRGRDLREYTFRGVAIGATVSGVNSELVYLHNILSDCENVSLSIYEYSYLIDGIRFLESPEYALFDEGFYDNKEIPF